MGGSTGHGDHDTVRGRTRRRPYWPGFWFGSEMARTGYFVDEPSRLARTARAAAARARREVELAENAGDVTMNVCSLTKSRPAIWRLVRPTSASSTAESAEADKGCGRCSRRCRTTAHRRVHPGRSWRSTGSGKRIHALRLTLLYELQVRGVCQTRRDVAVVAPIPQAGIATRWSRDPQQRRTFAARPV